MAWKRFSIFAEYVLVCEEGVESGKWKEVWKVAANRKMAAK